MGKWVWRFTLDTLKKDETLILLLDPSQFPVVVQGVPRTLPNRRPILGEGGRGSLLRENWVTCGHPSNPFLPSEIHPSKFQLSLYENRETRKCDSRKWKVGLYV